MSIIASRVVAVFFSARSQVLLLLVSLALGMLCALTMLPLSLIGGVGQFWGFPQGTIPGSETDMADCLVGYLYVAQSHWQLPVLFAPSLAAPAGTNVFWLDVIPWVALAGKAWFTATGALINPFGIYLFACFCLPGVAMTGLLAAAGQRNLAAALAGTALADATPYLLFRWGHSSLLGQFWLLVSFVLYLLWTREARNRDIAISWLALLSLTLLTNIYLFVMVAAVWGAAAVQRRVNGAVSNGMLLGDLAAAAGTLLCIMLVTGILSSDLGSAQSGGFGIYSLNLVGPIIPQMSGLIPPLSHNRVGMGDQYEGFAYLGAGALVIIAASLPGWVAWVRLRSSSHIVLICVLFAFWLFALSNKIYVGTHLIIELPLPDGVTHALSTFRSSGRFFWPIGYALVAGSVVLVLRRFRSATSLAVLAIAAALQLIDVAPIRAGIVATTGQPLPAIFDRQRAASLAMQSRAVQVFPSYGCIDVLHDKDSVSPLQRILLQQANMEFQLITARANLPINSVYNARLRTDCAAEDHLQRQTLQRGTLYVYLTDFVPTADQLGGQPADVVCAKLDWLRYCLIPALPADHRAGASIGAQ